MEDITFTTSTPFVLTVTGEVNSAKEVVCDLRPSAIAGEAGALLAEENLADLDDAGAARTNLGGTTTGVALFTAADAVAARTAIGATVTGSAVITAVNTTAARTAISAMSRSMTDAAGVAAALIDAADDAAAALAGVAVGAVYRTGSILKTRVA